MGIFSRIFGGDIEQDNPLQESTMDKSIRFHPDLIEILHQDHIAINNIFKELIQLSHRQPCDSVALNASVHDFKVALQNHSFTENVKIYAYLEQKFAGNPARIQFIKEMHKEMNAICYSVVKFTRRYQNTTFTEELRHSFIKELTDIGQALTKRVAMKEKELYPLYKA